MALRADGFGGEAEVFFERAGEVKARDPGNLRHAALRELFVEVRFDVPEGAAKRRHAGRHAVRLR